MRIALTIIHLVFITKARVKNSTDEVMGKLFGRTLKAWPLYDTHLENTMLAKGHCNLAQPAVLRAKLAASPVHTQHRTRSPSMSCMWLPHIHRGTGSWMSKSSIEPGFGLGILNSNVRRSMVVRSWRDPGEMRIDPADGKAYPFGEWYNYWMNNGIYKENEIMAYWDNECKPVPPRRQPPMRQQRRSTGWSSDTFPQQQGRPGQVSQQQARLDLRSESTGADAGMESGMVRTWNGDRGFGFIRTQQGFSVFCHVKNLVDGEGSVQEGDNVKFMRYYNEQRGKEEARQVLFDGTGDNFREENPFDKEDLGAGVFDDVSSVIDFDAYDDIPVETQGENVPPSISTFDDITLPDALVANIERCKFSKPTPVQKYSIPIALAERDLMACAQTGSGKTAGFMFPIVIDILRSGTKPASNGKIASPVALVLAPTRELAIQIHEETQKFVYQTGLRAVVAYGGAPAGEQLRNLRIGCDILIATPGRLSDFTDQGHVTMQSVKFLTLDEADRMLDMGFEPQIRKIVQGTDMKPKGQRLTFMFSATFPKEIRRLASDFLYQYIFLTVGRVGSTSDLIEQRIEQVDPYEKRDKLMSLVRREPGLTLVFVETKRNANILESFLCSNRVRATSIHGDRTQQEREDALRAFKSGDAPILVATAVAARGLDIPHVTHVINFDLPTNIDEYVHRIGRTGRAGKKGIATAFFDSVNDKGLSNDLMELLEEAKQEVPPWLKAEALANRRGRKGGGRKWNTRRGPSSGRSYGSRRPQGGYGRPQYGDRRPQNSGRWL
eukprot:gnl/MRDRNA2_/MRDRNA2_71144_c0_seq1.p1 gnl/MRDRNA2_/MRDRNA2_71144_c0~~gnl/MRDRNA2_/MRDRNA2_71144_c0_seq1.p1  ORF type:complete len:779 (+),score=105.00 gnl/MRDRNA2_/MRDRNA2_71144_c0_seq1:1-2337(+)